MKIAVIGAGNVGGALGRLWQALGHEIVFGVRDPGSAKGVELAKSTKARAASIAEAASEAGIVVLATPWPATEEALPAAGNLAGKIVVDCTNPLRPDLSVSIREHLESLESLVIPWRLPDLLELLDVDEREPCPV